MKKLFLVALAATAMVACTNDEVVSIKGGDSIAFADAFVDNATRANDPSTTTADIDGFNVYGFIDAANGKAVVFDGNEVTKNADGAWTYNDTQYWVRNSAYYFAALAPMNSANWTLTPETNTAGLGEVEFTNENGTEDLLYATEKIVTPVEMTSQPAAVKLVFNHLLSKVKFTFTTGFTSTKTKIQVREITMTAPKNATNNLAGTDGWKNHDDTTTLAFGDTDKLATGVSDDCTNERLTIPAGADYVYTINFVVDLYVSDVLVQTFNESTQLTGVALEAGRAYNFVAEVTPETLGMEPIVFDVEVSDWDNQADEDVVMNNTVVTNNQELEAALDLNEKVINITLNADAAVDVTAWATLAFGGASTEVINIDGNGHTLTFNQLDSDWNNISTANNATLNIKDAHLTSTGHNNGPWNRHDLNFACDVTLTNVTTDKAIALKAGGTLNNVTIADANTSDTYALWIQPKGQTVTLNNVVIDMLAADDGRGIKIDNQYVDAADEAKVTLNVNNVTFKTEEKSAIIVKSTKGAEINVNGIDITAVAADQQYAVWVDEATKTYANLVNVTGALCRVEGTTISNTTAADQSGLNSAMGSATNVNVELGDGNYSLPGATDKNIVISGDEGAVITVNRPAFHGSNVTFDGVTVKGSGYSTGVQHVNTVTYNDVKVIGDMCLYGEKVVFNGCTFELNNQYIWTYGAKVVEFNNCVFNTNGKAILVYNEGAGASDVTVKNCTFNATDKAYAGTISNLACAAIEIDNYQTSGVGTAHKVTTSGNTYNTTYFSGEWRIKRAVAGNAITVNGVEYTNMALDGRTMTFTSGTEVTVE